MQIKPINKFYNNYNLTSNHTTFNGSKFQRIIKKSIIREKFKYQGLDNIINIEQGEFGTICKNSQPLSKFPKPLTLQLKAVGLSTNTDGFAPCILKTKQYRPLSTSFVKDCSVMYLHNKKTKTHLLYHMYSDTNSDDIAYILEVFMPEGATKACIVPGEKYFTDYHARYLPDVFNTIKNKCGDIPISVHHMASNNPEIVGYKGCIYEITNKFTNNTTSHPYFENYNIGQASFKILDINPNYITSKLKYIDCFEELNDFKSKVKAYNITIRKNIEKLIDEKFNLLQKQNAPLRKKDTQFIKGIEEYEVLVQVTKKRTNPFDNF